ncbi:MAG: hypothetical protein PHV11_08710 [Candidatus Bipolaricaulis sp.]|jgi:hypothetical protein|nr:hypothetical protein [Candidatus Bipolaricaulis sp.]
MNEREMEEEAGRIIETPIGENQVSLRDVWTSWNDNGKGSFIDTFLLLCVRERNKAQKREEFERTVFRAESERIEQKIKGSDD